MTKHVLRLLDVEAPCCTNWTEECYAISDVNNNYHNCETLECQSDCANSASDECKDCCTVHETSWNCQGT